MATKNIPTSDREAMGMIASEVVANMLTLESETDSLSKGIKKFCKKPTKADAVRMRKAALEIQKSCAAIRKELLAVTTELK